MPENVHRPHGHGRELRAVRAQDEPLRLRRQLSDQVSYVSYVSYVRYAAHVRQARQG